MKKFAIFLCFILLVNISHQEEQFDFYEKIYDFVTNVLKGLADTNERKCGNGFVQYKPQLLVVFKSLMNDFLNGEELDQLIRNYRNQLKTIGTIDVDCKFDEFIIQLGNLKTLNGITQVGYRIRDQASQFFDYMKDMKEEKEFNDKIVIVGKILKIVFNISVN